MLKTLLYQRLTVFIIIIIIVMFVCVFQGGCLMAVGLGVAAAGFAGEHICWTPVY